MRRGPYRIVMAVAFAVSGCQSSCDPGCTTGTEPAIRTSLVAGTDEELPECGGVGGLRLVLEEVPGNTVAAPVGSSLQPGPTVRLLTAFTRNPAADIPVVFTVTGGGGRFQIVGGSAQTLTVETDAAGRATAPDWVLGPDPGNNTITASVNGIPLQATIKDSPLTVTVITRPATTIIPLAGNGQTAAAGSFLLVDPEVEVQDATGTPVANLPITFTVTAGGGSVQTIQSVTDANGRAKAKWRLGTAAGSNSFRVTGTGPGYTGDPLTFTATAVAGPAHTLSLRAGDNQTAAHNAAVTVPPAVKLVDANGNPVAGVVVRFTQTQGGGTVQGATATSGANGVATAGGWTLGPEGLHGLSAQAEGEGIIGNPVQFIAHSIQPGPAIVIAIAGDGQTGTAGFKVTTSPRIRFTTAGGTPIVGIGVIFQTDFGPGIVTGSVTGGTQLTDVNGEAAVGSWIMANQAGPNRLLATVAAPSGIVTGNPVTFTATGVAGIPVIMAKFSGDNQSAPVGFSPEVLPTVRIADFVNNPVAGVSVTFAVTGGGGIVGGATIVTDAQGRARVGSWQMGPTAGTNTLTATAAVTTIGGNPAVFTATGFLIGLHAKPAEGSGGRPPGPARERPRSGR